MAKLRTITIRRFKKIETISIDLDDATVLIGSNNAGKSTVLQAVHFAVAIAQTAKLVGDNVRWGRDHFELSFNPAQVLYSPVSDVLSLALGGNLVEAAEEQIEIELTQEDGHRCLVAIRRGRNRNIQVSIQGRVMGERLMDMARPYTIYAPGLAGIAKEERYMSPGVVRRIVARGDANLVLRNVLLMLREAEDKRLKALTIEWQRQYAIAEAAFQRQLGPRPIPVEQQVAGYKGPWSRFLADMQDLFPDIDITIDFDRERDEIISVFFKVGEKARLPIDAAGTSILQASQILAYIALFEPEVLILDEPDSHLHPNNQRSLCDQVLGLVSDRDFRVLLSTHSRHVLDATRDRAKIVWISEGKKVDYDMVSTPAMLMELGALDSVDYFTNGQLTCLVATEDSKRESLEGLSALLQSNGFPVGGFEIRPYAGCSKLDSAKVLRMFLSDKAPNVQFVLHRDRDYMGNDDAQNFTQQMQRINAHPFLTTCSDVEGHFLNPQHINAMHPQITVERATELIQEATLSTRDASISALINQRTDQALKARANGGANVNAGQIALTALNEYDADPAIWRRGKLVLNDLRARLNRELGAHPQLLRPSEYLRIPDLEAIKAVIWP